MFNRCSIVDVGRLLAQRVTARIPSPEDVVIDCGLPGWSFVGKVITYVRHPEMGVSEYLVVANGLVILHYTFSVSSGVTCHKSANVSMVGAWAIGQGLTRKCGFKIVKSQSVDSASKELGWS